jgi:hypothetical protein
MPSLGHVSASQRSKNVRSPNRVIQRERRKDAGSVHPAKQSYVEFAGAGVGKCEGGLQAITSSNRAGEQYHAAGFRDEKYLKKAVSSIE